MRDLRVASVLVGLLAATRGPGARVVVRGLRLYFYPRSLGRWRRVLGAAGAVYRVVGRGRRKLVVVLSGRQRELVNKILAGEAAPLKRWVIRGILAPARGRRLYGDRVFDDIVLKLPGGQRLYVSIKTVKRELLWAKENLGSAVRRRVLKLNPAPRLFRAIFGYARRLYGNWDEIYWDRDKMYRVGKLIVDKYHRLPNLYDIMARDVIEEWHRDLIE